MQLLIIIVGLALIVIGLYFAIGGFGHTPSAGSIKNVSVEGPAWLLLVAFGMGLLIFSAVWDWERSSIEAAGADAVDDGEDDGELEVGDPEDEEIPIEPTKTCPNGAVVALDDDCPPETKTCPDGAVVPVNDDCPPETKTCWNGDVVPVNHDCPPETKTCWNGDVVAVGEKCPSETKTCPDGSVVPVTDDCPPLETPNIMPDVIGKKKGDGYDLITSLLRELGVNYGSLEPTTCGGDGSIVDQDPAPGAEIDTSSRVVFTIETRARCFSAPDVVDMSLSSASKMLAGMTDRNHGTWWSYAESCPSTINNAVLGYVVTKQTPDPGVSTYNVSLECEYKPPVAANP